MEEVVKHRKVRTNGIWMHIAEKGEGPLVLLIHGFPELWFSWRHQIEYLSNNGYHVVAPDMRGYGDTDSPLHPSSYTLFHLVGDLIGLLDELNQEEAFVVGHDWGAAVAWYLSLFRPDRVRGLVAMSIPYQPRSPNYKTVEALRRVFGDGYYMSQFQEQGRAEKAFARYDYVTVMKKLMLVDKDGAMIAPPGVEIIDSLQVPQTLPSWITAEDLQLYADKFQESGFTGPLNYYRAMDLNWELLAPWQGLKIEVPTKFIIGDKDIGYHSAGTKDYIEGPVFRSLVPNLEVVVMANAHHYIQMERAQEVNDEILSFLATLIQS